MKPGLSQPAPAALRKARAEAAAWVVKLHGSQRTPNLEGAFREWLSADEENRRQFERVTTVWEDARGIPLGGIARVAYWNQPPVTRRWTIGAVALLFCCIVGLFTYWRYFADVYRTGVGEQRIVRLDDGSRVWLDSESQLNIAFSRKTRRVTLSKGRAYFEVAHNPSRPFVVRAGSHDVTAVGTSFIVRYDSGITAVTLVEGVVTVSGSARAPAPEAPPLPVLTLIPGERLVLSASGTPKLDFPPIDTVTAWRRGEIVLDKTPLDEAVSEMNRYEDQKLVIASSDIGKLRISGIYHVGDSTGFAKTIANLYRLKVSEGDGQIRLMDDSSTSPTPAR